MARLFNVALEEVTEEIDAAPAAEPLDEVEAIENSESAAADEAEINQGADEVTEALEEADALQEQVDVNDKILENTSDEVVEDAAASNIDNDVSGEVVVPESAVTESQVVEAQEALKYAIASFGNKVGYVNAVRVSTENAKRLSRREQLRIANEDAKDFINKLIETAKRLVAKIIAKVKVWAQKILLKFGNYEKSIDASVKALEGVKAADIDANVVRDDLVKAGIAETLYAVKNSTISPIVDGKTSAYDNELKQILNATKTGKNPVELVKGDVDVTKYGFKSVEGKVCGVTGTKALIATDKGYSTKGLEVDDSLKSANISVDKLLNSVTSNVVNIKKADLKLCINVFQKTQSAAEGELNKLKSEAAKEDKNAVAAKVEIAKSVGIVACMFRINEMIGEVKGFDKVAKALVKGKKGGDNKAEDKKEEAKA